MSISYPSIMSNETTPSAVTEIRLLLSGDKSKKAEVERTVPTEDEDLIAEAMERAENDLAYVNSLPRWDRESTSSKYTVEGAALLARLADATQRLAETVEDLTERIEAAKLALDYFRQPAYVGTKVLEVAEAVRWELDGQPDGADR